jgi:cytosine/adenosine deaminase-related metal-dependent hydrolase
MAGVTCIRRAAWAVLWDQAAKRHVYARDADIAFADGVIVQAGGRYAGAPAREIDGAGYFVIPGLIDVHCHPSGAPIFRGFTEEFGNPRLFYSGRHHFRQSFLPDEEAQRAAAAFTLCELLAGGVTTIVDLSHAYPGWLDVLARSGMRVCVAPMYRSAEWYTDTGQETQYRWAADDGRAAFAEAIQVMDEAERHPSGRLTAMVSPAQVDTCSEALLRDSIALAERSNRPLHIHAAQSYAEFQGMTRRNPGVTPIEFLDRVGVLAPRTMLGHAVFTDAHPWLHWPTRRDVDLLAARGISVAHCPTVFARDGSLLHDLGAYLQRGINVGIGTDTHPHNLLEEIRAAELYARLAAGPQHRMSTADAFACATTGGARALLRDDLGRIAPGARADLALVRLDHPAMLPPYDPLRSLIHAAAERAVAHVFVDGAQVVADGEVLTLDRAQAARELGLAQERAAQAVPRNDPQGRSIEAIAPRALPFAGQSHQA